MHESPHVRNNDLTQGHSHKIPLQYTLNPQTRTLKPPSPKTQDPQNPRSPKPASFTEEVLAQVPAQGEDRVQLWGFLLPLLLGGSWVVISCVISRVTVLRTHIRGLITYNHTYNYP